MDNQLKQIGRRIQETRQVLNISVAEMAKVTGVSEEEYLQHEDGSKDSSFTFLYHCAERFGIDISDLVTGISPHLSFYELTRMGGGMPIKRRKGFDYRHLASLLKNRLIEPFVVTARPEDENAPIPLSTHAGFEFDYILKGTLKVQLDGKTEVLREGDSITYDSSHPHGMTAIGNTDCEFLAIVTKTDHQVDSNPEPIEQKSILYKKASSDRPLLYQEYMTEIMDENGHLKDVRFHYPDNFNFAYDVVDRLAEKEPDKLAMLWLSNTKEERHFTFRDIAEQSCRAANYFASLGIGKGDRVMLVLKRHYQFWFILNALHRIGAIAVPASCQLLAHDFVYRFQHASIKAVICSSDGEIAENADEAIRECPSVKIRIMVNGSRNGWLDFDEALPRYSHVFPRPEGQKYSDPCLMFFSSGTTGYPKMVSHSYTYPLGHIITARRWQCVDPDGLHFTISDTGWGKALWGKIYGQWLCEAAVFTYDFDRFHAADILELFAKYHITTFCAPPTMYRFFIKEDLSKYDLSSIKHAAIAGEALNPEVFQQFYNATGLKVMEGFGQTESTLMLGNLEGMTPKPGSMGKPTP